MSASPTGPLVAAAKAGDRDALEAILRAEWPHAWRAALSVTGRRDLAEDAVQEGFLAAARGISRVDPQRPIGPWLRRIVVNQALNLLRAERRRQAYESRAAGGEVDRADPHGEEVAVLSAVVGLDEDRRVVVALRYWLDYEPGEVEEFLERVCPFERHQIREVARLGASEDREDLVHRELPSAEDRSRATVFCREEACVDAEIELSPNPARRSRRSARSPGSAA